MSVKTKGREIAIRALYAVEAGNNHIPDAMLSFKHEAPATLEYALKLVEGTLSKLNEIDIKISTLLKNWRLERINVIDKEI